MYSVPCARGSHPKAKKGTGELECQCGFRLLGNTNQVNWPSLESILLCIHTTRLFSLYHWIMHKCRRMGIVGCTGRECLYGMAAEWTSTTMENSFRVNMCAKGFNCTLILYAVHSSQSVKRGDTIHIYYLFGQGGHQHYQVIPFGE